MKDEYMDTAFGNLIISYAVKVKLSDDVIEKALRSHAQKWGGCISCRYSMAGDAVGKGNVWFIRRCQVGLTQDNCKMWESFPE